MVSGHLHVQLADCSVERNISVLLVHVMHGSSGLVTQDDSEGLNMIWTTLIYFVD